ncbi:hypothetical protein D3C72_1822330 [compost metagenome]
MQRGDHVDGRRQLRRGDRVRHRQVQERHSGKAQPRCQRLRGFHQFLARLDAVDVRIVLQCLEEQVVQDETEVRLAGAMVDQREAAALVLDLPQQRLDELEQVVDLLELAPAVLVHLAVARQDMEFLEQLDGLAGADFVGI